MEKTKKGLSLVAIVLAIVLLGGVVGYVVYAAISQTFNFGGNVSFVADGVEATIKATDWEGCTIGGEEYSSGQSILQTITYSTDKDSDSSDTVKNSWSNLTIVVTDSTDGTATITFSVSNNFTDDTTISVTIGEISNASDDLTIEVDPDYATISAGESEEFVITFTLDANYSLTSATFSIPITLAIVETYSVSVSDSFNSKTYYAIDDDTSWSESTDDFTVSCKRILIVIAGEDYFSVDWTVTENTVVDLGDPTAYGPTASADTIVVNVDGEQTDSASDLSGDYATNCYAVLFNITADCSISITGDSTVTVSLTYVQ